MKEEERTLDTIRSKLHELNFNINEEVIGRIYSMFAEKIRDSGPGEVELDLFIKELISNGSLVELQMSSGVNDGMEFDRSWRSSRRSSVYSEKVSPETFHLEYYPKDKETTSFLESTLVCDIPFGFLNPEQKMKLIGSMTPENVDKGMVIIQEGELGSQMYIVESGEFEVSKGGSVLRKLTRGSFFGEIALIHNIPRTATVRAVVDSRIWVVEQTSFSGIKMVDRISNKRKIFEGLREQNVFPSLSDNDYESILDALSFVYYEEGSRIEISDSEFFMVLMDAEIDDGGIRKIKSKEILRSGFIAVTAIQGTHIGNKQRYGSSKFLKPRTDVKRIKQPCS